MSTVSEEILADCLELLSDGLTADQILARYPDHQEALRPFLETAVQLTKLATQPTLAAKERSRQAMLRRAAEMRTVRRARPSIWSGLQRLLLPVGSLAAVLFLIGAVVLIISASSVPGDGLYGAKRLVERARLAPLANPEARKALLETFNQERIREVEALLRSDRAADVQFEGAIEEITADYWTVAGIRVEITAETIIDGSPRSGAEAKIEGRTGSGKLAAARIIVAADDLPVEDDSPDPELEPEISPTATMTPKASATMTPTTTATPTPTAPVAAETPPSSTLPVSPPTDTPVPPAPPPGNENGSDDQTNDNGGNENEGEDETNENQDNENEDKEDDENVNDNGSGNENDHENENDHSGPGNGNDNDNGSP